MEITSHQAANIRFTLRGYGYDQHEVDEFRMRVERALRAYERQSEEMKAGTVSRAPQAAELEEQSSLLGGRPASGVNGALMADPPSWGEDAGSAELPWERSAVRGGGDEAAAHLAAAREEATRVLAAARMEGENLIAEAKARAASAAPDPGNQAPAITQRLARLRAAVGDVETRLRDLLGSTVDELALVGDLIDLETGSVSDIPILRTDSPWGPRPQAVPREAAPREAAPREAAPREAESRTIVDDRAPVAERRRLEVPVDIVRKVPGFYEKRLAGLRERIDRNDS